MFSTLTITSDDIPQAITLTRTEDFPSHKFDYKKSKYHSKPTWQSSWYPQSAGHLSLRLTERISGGRSAVTYAAEIVSGNTNAVVSGVTASHPIPSEPELCVKVARLNCCRTLAREAWIYDKLRRRARGRDTWLYDQLPPDDKLQGIIAPHFYGLFTAETLPGQFSPWSTEDFKFETAWDDNILSDEDEMSDDFLPDDNTMYPEHSWYNHGVGGRELSEWCHWRPDPAAPVLAVIVMSRGGPTYTFEDHMDPATQDDIHAILDDLSLASLVHGDLRPANIVRAPASTMPCERHKCIHKWNVIDFSRALVDDYDPENAEIPQTNEWCAKRMVHNLQNYSYSKKDTFFYR
ncbi:hypothetical protein CONPUDRAFT_108718 [Coniophora puteana RWD-64-598 SS2]|uniref:Protein kinase domain-containing protein n=1 Tax=Coniophora puteana (strain RWD-64-598) TaxID=741705 RepID=A0A5M3MHL4_CONPW|nr:uncharacterized protein CONPUDRAFT_108718 [Coniophora puteana RWD-64-598 SS2]EIW78718.1 hypothetical protein CONPUDRAFT_108718 [Coniophora puteana RWD-64-598 SS2]